MTTSVPPATPVIASPAPGVAPARTAWIDQLRVAMTMLVVLHHVAIVYGGSGGWYWKDAQEASSLPLVMFNAVNQSFFMGFFFLLAGYYTPTAYERKGARRFVTDRLIRLGIPLVIYFFVLSPITTALARRADGASFRQAFFELVSRGQFEPGPLWFAEALLLMALAYVVWRWLRPAAATTPNHGQPSHRNIALAIAGIGLANVLVRWWIPVGENVAWLQLGFFPAYILLFAVGCSAARSGWLERVTPTQALPWLTLSVGAIATLPFALEAAENIAPFTGGWNRFALYYAWWDPLVGVGILLALLYAGRRVWLAEKALMWLNRRAFGIFIIHPPVVVALSISLRDWQAAGELKFVVVGLLACLGSALVTGLLLRIPAARRVL